MDFDLQKTAVSLHVRRSYLQNLHLANLATLPKLESQTAWAYLLFLHLEDHKNCSDILHRFDRQQVLRLHSLMRHAHAPTSNVRDQEKLVYQPQTQN